jgi:organic radical activating enzyme
MIPIFPNSTNVNPETFCIGPFSEIRINSNGTMNFCHYASRNEIPKIDNIQSTTVDDYFRNSVSVLNARTALASGKTVDRCHKCYAEEKQKLISFRHRRNLQAGIFLNNDFLQSFEESNFSNLETAASQPRFYHVSFNNVCNMACLMCNSENSTLLGKTLTRAGLIQPAKNFYNDWTQTPAWEKFLNHLLNNDQIVCLHIMGGEPFFQPKFLELLKFLSDNNHTDFHFTVVTNGSIYSNELIDYFKLFKSVQIEISVEGVGLANDYIRYPGKTQDIIDNILLYAKHRNDKFDVVLRSVPQILSVLDYASLIEFAWENKLSVDSNILHDPLFLLSSLLPADIKTTSIEKLKKTVSKFESQMHYQDEIHSLNNRNSARLSNNLAQNVDLVIGQISNEVKESQLLTMQLINYCAKLDRYRNIDVRNFVPELTDFFNSNGYNEKRY